MTKRSAAAACAVLALLQGRASADVEPVYAASVADAFRVVRWTTSEGLPQNTVNDLIVLPNGELWLATFGGLARFDGHTFKVVDIASDEGLPANRIVGVAPLGADAFYFLTQEGHLGRVRQGRPETLLSPPRPALEFVQLVRGGDTVYGRASDGRVWHTDGTTWQVLGIPRTPPRIDALALDGAGAVWARTESGLVNVTDPRDGAVRVRETSGLTMSPRRRGGLWIGQRTELGVVERGMVSWLRVDPPLSEPVWVIEPSSDGALWVGLTHGVVRLEEQADGRWRSTRLPIDIPPPFAVRSVTEDHNGTLWVGTAGAGLVRVNRHTGRRLVTAFGAVSGLSADGAGGAFVSAGCGRLMHIDAVRQVREIVHGQPRPPCQIALDRGRDGQVWARVGPRLVRVSAGVVRGGAVATDLPNEEGPIAVAADGSIWVASRSGSVSRVSQGGARLDELSLRPPLASLAVGQDGALWVGGDGEVTRIQGGTVSRFGPAEQMPRGQVRDMLPLSDGSVWVATYGGGLGLLRDGRVTRVTVSQGLPDNSISRLLVDSRDRMWISTNRGVAVIDMRTLRDTADGRVRDAAPVVLGPERGVPEANFGSPAGFVGGHDELWFGTIDGLVVIEGATFPLDSTPPVVHIEEVRSGGRVFEPGPVVRIPPLTTRVSLGFTVFELLYPERLRFRFRVEGIDSDWVDAGTARSIEWTPPGPGRHSVRVEARSPDGIWSATPASVLLEVLPAWWQTLTVRVSGTLLLVLLAVMGVRARTRFIERRHDERVRVVEEQRRSEQRVSDMRAQLDHVSRAALAGELTASIAHEVRQPLGAIVNNAEAARRDLPQYLGRPGDLQQVLDDIVSDAMRASEVVQGLRGFLQPSGPESGPIDLSALVREVLPLVRHELQDNRIAMDLDLATDLPPVEGFRVQLGQIVVNLLLNACDALASIDGERRITICTGVSDGRVVVTVRDSGPGLSPEIATRLFEPFVTTKPGGLGMGLAICRSIAERHGGGLTAAAAPEGGLVATLSLPVARTGGGRP